MKRYMIQWLCLALMLVATACEDYRLSYMVDDKVYLLNPGLNRTTIFNWGDFTYDLYVMKGGKGQQGASVRLSINEAVLQSYNEANGTAYKLMPADCYSVSKERLSFGENDYRMAFQIRFDANKVKSLQSTSENPYAVPCLMSIEDGSIEAADENKMSSIIIPTVVQPYLALNNPGLFLPGATFTLHSDDEMIVYSKLHTNYFNQWDLSYTLEVDATVLENYNAKAGTNYKMLPEAAYEIDRSTWNLPAKRDEQYIKIKLTKKALINGDNYLFGNYAIPIRLASVSMHGIDPEANTMIYPVIFQPNELDKSTWSISGWNSCIKEEPQYAGLDRGPEKVLDGNRKTFWGSKWDAPKPLPYYIEIDMGLTKQLFTLGYILPEEAWRGNIKSGYFETSLDKETWAKVGEWNSASNDLREVTVSIKATKARYFRMVITDAFGYDNPSVGKDSGARCDIAEIGAWGL